MNPGCAGRRRARKAAIAALIAGAIPGAALMQNPQDMDSINAPPGLHHRIDAQWEEDRLRLRVELSNRGAETLAVWIPPDPGPPLVDGDAAAGTIRVLDQLVDALSMTPIAPLERSARILRPGDGLQAVREVARPFQRHWPAGYGPPEPAPLPAAPRQVEYCYGVAELAALPGAAALDPAASVISLAHGNVLALDAQRVVCAAVFPVPGAD